MYLSYVLRHKWWVFVAGVYTGAPLWRLFIHDWTKFLPCEWSPYVDKFYGAWVSKPEPGGMTVTSNDPRTPLMIWQDEINAAFDRAWLHHQHTNAHHWQHWILQEDRGGKKVLEMPEPLVREMVADWMGAGRAITGCWEVEAWYDTNRNQIQLHPKTRDLVEHLICTYGPMIAGERA